MGGLEFGFVGPVVGFAIQFTGVALRDRRKAAGWPKVLDVANQALRDAAPPRRPTPRGSWRVVVTGVREGCQGDPHVRGLFDELASRAAADAADRGAPELPAVLIAGVSEEAAREMVASLGKVGIDAFATPRRHSVQFLRPKDTFLQVLLVAPAAFVGALAGLPNRSGPPLVLGWIALLLAVLVGTAGRRMTRMPPVFQLPPSS
jgi:hypothetical protein